MSQKVIYSFIGLPASGKGTQAAVLQQKLNTQPFIGIGDLIRGVISKPELDPFEQIVVAH